MDLIEDVVIVAAWLLTQMWSRVIDWWLRFLCWIERNW